MSYRPGERYSGEFTTSDPSTAAVADADGLPVATAVRNRVDDPGFVLTVTRLGTGLYSLAGTIPAGYAADDSVQIRVAATVGGVPGLGVVDSFTIDGPGGGASGPDLIAEDDALAALSELGLTAAQLAYLPAAIAAASAIVRRSCGDRDFDQRAYDAIFPLQLDGTVSLPQVPVSKVSRVSIDRSTAITITNADRAGNQRATVEFACSGDEAQGITYTGLTLTRTSSGVTTSTDLAFSGLVTLSALAAAVNALGHGWAATVASGFEAWGTTELIAADDTAQDTFAGAAIEVWGSDLQGARVNRRTGILAVGNAQALGLGGPRWGPGWEVLERDDRESIAKCRVAYTAGFATIPGPVRQAVALTVSAMLSSLRTDPRLSSEGDGAYSYVINTAFADFALPKTALGLLSPYVLHHT